MTDDIKLWSDSAIKRLDHVHGMLETIAKHSGDQVTMDVSQQARELIEGAQEDIREVQEMAEKD